MERSEDMYWSFDWTQNDTSSTEEEEWSLVSTLWRRTEQWSPLLRKMCCCVLNYYGFLFADHVN